VPNAGHTLNGRSVSGSGEARNFNLEAQKLNALSAVLDPFLTRLKITLNTLHQFFGDAGQFVLRDILDDVVEPAFARWLLSLL